MRIVTIVTSRGKNQQIQTNASVWSQLVAEIEEVGLSVDGMKAIVGQTKVTLESAEAVLPTTNFTLFLSPVKIKAGFDALHYDLDYKSEELEGLGYQELRSELKSIRTQASELEDEATLEIIGNYTHDTVEALRNKLVAVYEALKVVEEDDDEVSEVVETPNVDGLAERIFEIEFLLGIVNPQNEAAFYQRKQEELERVLETI